MSLHNPNAAQMYKHHFDRFLAPGENILNAAPSIHIETSVKYGRGTGDGTIAITSSRIIHVFLKANFSGPGFALNRSDIEAIKKSRSFVPLSSNLKVSGDTAGNPWVHNFSLGNRFLNEVLGFI
jgi:hypothetical protein